MINNYITLDAFKEDSGIILNMKEFDKVDKLYVTITQNEVPVELSEFEYFAQFIYKLPNGIKDDGACSIENGRIVVSIPRDIGKHTGITECQIKLYTMDDCGCPSTFTSPNFRIVVTEAIYDEATMESLATDSEYSELVNNENIRQSAEAEREEHMEARVAENEAFNRASEERQKIVDTFIPMTESEVRDIINEL